LEEGVLLTSATLSNGTSMLVSGRLTVLAPPSLAVDLAGESGLTLVAFLRGDGMNIYSRPDRITA
jgi:formate dehydrogenase assembly factor FdhD